MPRRCSADVASVQRRARRCSTVHDPCSGDVHRVHRRFVRSVDALYVDQVRANQKLPDISDFFDALRGPVRGVFRRVSGCSRPSREVERRPRRRRRCSRGLSLRSRGHPGLQKVVSGPPEAPPRGQIFGIRGVSPPVGPPSAPYGGVLGPRARCRGPRRPPTPPTGALRMPLGAGSPPYRGV